VEVLRLHARDAQARAIQWFDSCGWMQSDILLRAALHLRSLEEYEEAGYLAERSAEIESGTLENGYDAYVALSVAVSCHALSKKYNQVERLLGIMLRTAEAGREKDSAWKGFLVGSMEGGWDSTWTEEGILHVSLAYLFLCIITGRNEQMSKWLGKVKSLIGARGLDYQDVSWNAIELLVKNKRSEIESSEEELRKSCKAHVLLIVHEEYVTNLLDEAIDLILLKPNWEL
jgi:hypothetical protein